MNRPENPSGDANGENLGEAELLAAIAAIDRATADASDKPEQATPPKPLSLYEEMLKFQRENTEEAQQLISGLSGNSGDPSGDESSPTGLERNGSEGDRKPPALFPQGVFRQPISRNLFTRKTSNESSNEPDEQLADEPESSSTDEPPVPQTSGDSVEPPSNPAKDVMDQLTVTELAAMMGGTDIGPLGNATSTHDCTADDEVLARALQEEMNDSGPNTPNSENGDYENLDVDDEQELLSQIAGNVGESPAGVPLISFQSGGRPNSSNLIDDDSDDDMKDLHMQLPGPAARVDSTALTPSSSIPSSTGKATSRSLMDDDDDDDDEAAELIRQLSGRNDRFKAANFLSTQDRVSSFHPGGRTNASSLIDDDDSEDDEIGLDEEEKAMIRHLSGMDPLGSKPCTTTSSEVSGAPVLSRRHSESHAKNGSEFSDLELEKQRRLLEKFNKDSGKEQGNSEEAHSEEIAVPPPPSSRRSSSGVFPSPTARLTRRSASLVYTDISKSTRYLDSSLFARKGSRPKYLPKSGSTRRGLSSCNAGVRSDLSQLSKMGDEGALPTTKPQRAFSDFGTSRSPQMHRGSRTNASSGKGDTFKRFSWGTGNISNTPSIPNEADIEIDFTQDGEELILEGATTAAPGGEERSTGCPRCHVKLPDSLLFAAYCPSCGAKLPS